MLQGVCWGLAYKVPEKNVEATIKYLDHREKAGYSVGDKGERERTKKR